LWIRIAHAARDFVERQLRRLDHLDCRSTRKRWTKGDRAHAERALHLACESPGTDTQAFGEHLLHQGAGIDVVGWDLYKVSALKEEVLRRYPRQAFKAQICEALESEAREHPSARPALMLRLGFVDIIRNSPYDE
jgi:hypothetical protein